MAQFRARGQPWHPSGMPPGVDVSQFAFMAVDDLTEGALTLRLARWPSIDNLGRLRFPAGYSSWTVAADPALFNQFLLERVPIVQEEDQQAIIALRVRPVRVGDVFGATVLFDRLTEFCEEADQEVEVTGGTASWRLNAAEWIWLLPPVFDVTAVAREAAKVSASAVGVRPLRVTDFNALLEARRVEAARVDDPDELYRYDLLAREESRAQERVERGDEER